MCGVGCSVLVQEYIGADEVSNTAITYQHHFSPLSTYTFLSLIISHFLSFSGPRDPLFSRASLFCHYGFRVNLFLLNFRTNNSGFDAVSCSISNS